MSNPLTGNVTLHVMTGDHVKLWYQDDTRAVRVDGIHRTRDDKRVVVGRRLADRHVVALPYTPALVLVFRPLTDNEIFWCAEGIARDSTTGCSACGSKWHDHQLDHSPTCRYIKTLDERTTTNNQGASK